MLLKLSNMKNRLYENGLVGAMKGTSNVNKEGRPTYKFLIHIVYYCKQKIWLFFMWRE